MKVLLIYANTFDYLAPPPVGLSLLTGPLRQAGHAVAIADLMKEPDPDRVIEDAIARHRPEIIGLSLRNLDNQGYAAPRDFVPDYVRWVGIANRAAPTIIGGSAVMSMPEALYARTGATYALAGQGDRAFPAFLRELAAGKTAFEAPGILWREGNAIRRNPGLMDGYLEGGTIDWGAIDRPRYKKDFMNACVITKTGCAHRCLFCDAEASFGGAWTPRTPEAILADLDRDAREFGLHRQDYFFIDNVFNQPLDWAKSVLEAIARSDRRPVFSAIIEPTPDLDREFARLLRRAGCTMVTTLLNSMDDAVLGKMRRPFTVESVDRAFALFDAERIWYMPQFMLGGPGETRETVLKNFDHLKRWKPIMSDASFGLRIMPHAGLKQVAIDEGVIAADADLLQPTFYLSEPLRNDLPWLAEQIRRLKRFRVSSLPRWADLLWITTRAKYRK